MIARPQPRPGPIPFSSTLSPQMSAIAQGIPPSHTLTSISHTMRPPSRTRQLLAHFHGHGVLCVRSSVTGAFYRFERHGDALHIDPRDALLLSRLTDVQVR
jgi:hypothetical protein